MYDIEFQSKCTAWADKADRFILLSSSITQSKLLTQTQQTIIRIALEINAFKIARLGLDLAGYKATLPNEKPPPKSNLKKGKGGGKKVIIADYF